jgi:ribosomal protein S17E
MKYIIGYCFICLLCLSCATNSAVQTVQTPVNSNNKAEQTARQATGALPQAPDTSAKSQTEFIGLPDDTLETVYFRGFSARKPNLQEALNDAEKDARTRVAGYIAVLVEEKVADTSVYKSSMEQVIENTETVFIASSSYTGNVVREVRTIDSLPKSYPDGTVEAQIVAAVDRQVLNNAIASFNKETSANYSNRIRNVSADTLYNALAGYENIRGSFNPLEKVIAVYDGNGAEQGLRCYDLVISRIRETASDTQFTGDFAYTVQKGDRLDISVGITSKSINNIGTIEGVFTYAAGGTQSARVNDNVLRFQIDTARLSPGNYACVIELQMKNISPELANIRQNIALTVTTINAPLVFAGDTIGESEQGTLTQSLQQALEKYGTPVSIIAEQAQAELATPNRCEFVITLNKTEYPNGFIGYYVTFTFSRNGRPIATSERREFRDTSTNLLFNNFIGGFIRDNQKFFQDMNVALGG